MESQKEAVKVAMFHMFPCCKLSGNTGGCTHLHSAAGYEEAKRRLIAEADPSLSREQVEILTRAAIILEKY